MWAANSFHGFALVKLQRPLPVIMTFREGRGIFSSTKTFPEGPSIFVAPTAAINPEAPAPTINMSAFLSIITQCLYK